ncbi:hypothetical protein F971_03191 [Acinetobacter vivianii]|uniref:Uncharacterized protein n=1 Tax=Acinetobacter vivianii TaxID=1776742 RepID=N8W8N3_9GAMM|nr:immunity 26/phosphotriesterase HocA family protein [Acinetobacter vivianii]ENU91284.1 hypothetical protein F971_03191 [Acinetobacter vivianii]
MVKKLKSFKRKEGDILLIKLSNNTFCYGRVLTDPLFVFYDLNTSKPLLDINQITEKNILFKVWVMKHAITSGRWEVIGNQTLEDTLVRSPLFFKQDILSKELSIYNPTTGQEIDASYEECKNLERAAVWEPEHVEDRLEDIFEGRNNKWVESLRPKI